MDDFDRTPPNDLEAERCLLASYMLDHEVFDELGSTITRDHFYSADHQIIFDVLGDLHRGGIKVDAVILRAELEKRLLLQEVGGVAYIGQILVAVPSAAHFRHYAKIVRDIGQKRFIIDISNKSLREVYGASEPIKIIERAKAQLDRISEGAAPVSYIRIRDAVANFYEEKTNGNTQRFIQTTLPSLDEVIYGFPIPGFSILAGRGGMAKSLLAKQFCREIAFTGFPTLLVAVEESEQKVSANAVSAMTGLDSREMFNTKWSSDVEKKVAAATMGLNIPFYITDKATKISDICATIKQAKRKEGVRVAFVDHLHLVDAESDDSREQQISKIVKRLKLLAKSEDMHICGCCQLNKGGGGIDNYKRRPMPVDLRDSGSLFDDADQVMMIHRSDYYHVTDPTYSDNNVLELYVHKHKFGESQALRFFFDGAHSLVREWDQFADGPLPDWSTLQNC